MFQKEHTQMLQNNISCSSALFFTLGLNAYFLNDIGNKMKQTIAIYTGKWSTTPPPPPTLPLTTTGIGKREREWYCRIQNTASRGRRQTRTFSTLVSCRREKRILYIDLLARGLCHNSLEVGDGIIFWKNVFFFFFIQNLLRQNTIEKYQNFKNIGGYF